MAALKTKIRLFTISIGMKMVGPANGAVCCFRLKICRRCLQAIVSLDAWNELSVLQHAPWLGRLLCALVLRKAGITGGAHLAAINPGLKTIPVDRRRHRDRETRMLVIAHGLLAAAEIGMKEHCRLVPARTVFEQKLEARRIVTELGLHEMTGRGGGRGGI